MREVEPRVQRPRRLRRLVNHVFPERQLHLRTEGRVSFIRLTRGTQIIFAMAVALASAWMAFSSVTYVLHERVVAAKDNEVANARLAYRSVLFQVAEYQKKFTGIAGDLEENYDLMLDLVEHNTDLQQNLKAVENQLVSIRRDRRKVISMREELGKRLADIQEQMRALANRNFTLRDDLDTIETNLQAALAERNEALFNGNRMRRQIRGLEVRLVRLQRSQQDSVQRLTEQTVANIDGIEKVVELAGLKLSRLLSSGDEPTNGQGGPFINAHPDTRPDTEPAAELEASLTRLYAYLDRWQALQSVMQRLPLTTPLNYFNVTSSFGKRRDPINKRWAMHYGVDMGSVFKSSVYVTAPGVVTYVGWKGKYGRLIEVDHGAGIKTRYGHLHKTLVKKGQKVSFRKKIGLLGSTGRSTGAHLHYEVLFKGSPHNPMNLIKAGHYVFQE